MLELKKLGIPDKTIKPLGDDATSIDMLQALSRDENKELVGYLSNWTIQVLFCLNILSAGLMCVLNRSHATVRECCRMSQTLLLALTACRMKLAGYLSSLVKWELSCLHRVHGLYLAGDMQMQNVLG